VSLPAIVRLRNYRHYDAPGSGVIYLDYSAPKDKVFVAVVLGTENKDGTDPLPIVDFLRNLVIDGVAVVPQPAEAQS
jgi:hypothetical protein